ncbi:class I SAM-dependent methyltransferase [Clostridium sp. 19966]|uniref:class I SAM-dependent methyltransferase n=1 Tax=Clostridium sp. 19966 TaxID=2768166 RepID=UPI0028E06343|nr:class I SAM-dependent methyltransferase [Clostridium sp. 19966]MDT8717887.1 class I SAM-dependent methyltransferase [Clostridium sp. 19966]
MKWEDSLFNRVKDIQSYSFLNEDAGENSLSTCYILAYLVSYFKFKNYVEIGVYKGRSLFSVAQAINDNEGKAYGIDPYYFEAICSQVVMNTEVSELSKVVEIIGKTSTKAAPYFKDIEIDMLHINGSHDYESVQADMNNYSPLIREGGIIIFNRIDLDSVKCCYNQCKNDYITLLETNKFGILMKNHKNLKRLNSKVDISKKLKNLYFRLLELENETEYKKITVNVGVLAYNHENYIVDCLNSIIKQKGDFNLNIIICEDNSSDATAGIVQAYINNVEVGENVTFEFLKSEENLGMVKNLRRLLKACSKSRYTALMDGDDYWDDEYKLQTHIDFMESHPQCSISFDDIIFFDETNNNYNFYNIQQQIKGDILTTSDITSINFIANISCCFYYSKYFDQIPNEFFEMFVGDWMLNIEFSTFGEIGHVKKAMTVYRRNEQGIWSGMDENQKNKKTIELIDAYNKFLNYNYNEEFSHIRKFCDSKSGNRYLEPLIYRPIRFE